MITDFEAQGLPLDGIWLDYIRYPGRWSVLDPKVPDTCYCGRCLEAFSKDSWIQVPRGAGTEESSRWIKEHCAYEWMRWKKEQINAFVQDVRKILDQYPEKTRPVLGIFLVPWTKGDRQNGVCYGFGQDGFELGKYADVLSPMVYHKRVGRPASWVGYMTRYYEETVSCEVWPIVQGMDCSLEEFAEVMRYAGEGGAQGVLGYPFGPVMEGKLWEGFRGFERLSNLLGSTDYADYTDERKGLAPSETTATKVSQGRQRRSRDTGQGAEEEQGKEKIKKVRGLEGEKGIENGRQMTEDRGQKAQVKVEAVRRVEGIGIRPGYGECREWVMLLPDCRKHGGRVYTLDKQIKFLAPQLNKGQNGFNWVNKGAEAQREKGNMTENEIGKIIDPQITRITRIREK